MRKRASLALAAATSLAAALIVGAESPVQAADDPDLVGTAPVLPREASATELTVLLFSEMPTPTADGRYADPATAPVTTHATVGSAFELNVPDSWYRDGYANVTVVATTGTQQTFWNTTAYQGERSPFAIQLPWRPIPQRGGVEPAAACEIVDAPNSQKATRIGEVHVAQLSGNMAKFVYRIKEDSDVSTGVKFGTDGWEVSGSKHLGSSLSAEGGARFDENRYANTHIIYGGKWAWNYNEPGVHCPYERTSLPGDSVGDLFRGPNKPPNNPWGSCHDSPDHVWATVARNGYWEWGRGQAKKYDLGANLFGFWHSTQTGFTENIFIRWVNHNDNRATYVCGRENPRTAPVLYNSLW